MADELEVVVRQEVGMISWNFEQLKSALAVKMQEYEGLVYTEENVKTAKNDVAELRKLKKAISDKRIEIKNKCLEPYGIIEMQADELTELIDRPIEKIDGQLSEYEKKRRGAVRKTIMDFFDETGKDLPGDILAKLKEAKYQDRWENVSTSAKLWKQGVMDAVKAASRSLKAISEVEEEFREAALDAFRANLDLNDAMAEVTKARKQKEIILARERERIAAEERAKAEAEAKAKMEAEKKRIAEESKKAASSEAQKGAAGANAESGATVPKAAPQNAEKRPNSASEDGVAGIVTLRIRATSQQLAKIKGYIEYCGAAYREV